MSASKEQAQLLLYTCGVTFENACRSGALSVAKSIYAGLGTIPSLPKAEYLCGLALSLWRERQHPRVCRWLLRAAARQEVLRLALLQTTGRKRDRGDWNALADLWSSGWREYPDFATPGGE